MRHARILPSSNIIVDGLTTVAVPDYIDYADITPTFAYISVNGGEPYWVPVMTTEGKGDDRT